MQIKPSHPRGAPAGWFLPCAGHRPTMAKVRHPHRTRYLAGGFHLPDLHHAALPRAVSPIQDSSRESISSMGRTANLAPRAAQRFSVVSRSAEGSFSPRTKANSPDESSPAERERRQAGPGGLTARSGSHSVMRVSWLRSTPFGHTADRPNLTRRCLHSAASYVHEKSPSQLSRLSQPLRVRSYGDDFRHAGVTLCVTRSGLRFRGRRRKPAMRLRYTWRTRPLSFSDEVLPPGRTKRTKPKPHHRDLLESVVSTIGSG